LIKAGATPDAITNPPTFTLLSKNSLRVNFDMGFLLSIFSGCLPDLLMSRILQEALAMDRIKMLQPHIKSIAQFIPKNVIVFIY
jgi:hypothetical protein